MNDAPAQTRRTNLFLELLAAVNQADEPGQWLASALPAIAGDLAAGYVALAAAEEGRWNALAKAGSTRSLPAELLAEVLDGEVARSQGNWVAGPLSSRTDSAEALAACWPSAPPPDALASVESLLPVVREALALVRSAISNEARSTAWRRFWKSPASGTGHARSSRCWSQMAEAATRLLEGRSGQHLPLGPREPLLDRPSGLGSEGRRTPRGRRPRRRRPRRAVGPAGAG